MEDRELDRALEVLKQKLDDDIARSGALDRILAGVQAGVADEHRARPPVAPSPTLAFVRMRRPAPARTAAALLAACLAGVAVGIALPAPEDRTDVAATSLDSLTFGPLEGFEP